MIKSDNIDDLYLELITVVSDYPQYKVKPRGQEVKEIIASQVNLTNPLNCLTTLKDRKLNYRFSIIEKLEYLSGESNVERIGYYNGNIKNFANKYEIFDGAYGPRLRYWLEYIYKLLKDDPDTRQAVISIYGNQDRHQSPDIPCTLSLQFLLRNNKLNLIVTMRSNDLLWGFPYDVNAFCFLQEVMAFWLGVEIGDYYHKAGSMHLYTEREAHLTDLLKNKEKNDRTNPRWDLSFEETWPQLNLFWYIENKLRKGKNYKHYKLESKCLTEYLTQLKPKEKKDDVQLPRDPD